MCSMANQDSSCVQYFRQCVHHSMPLQTKELHPTLPHARQDPSLTPGTLRPPPIHATVPRCTRTRKEVVGPRTHKTPHSTGGRPSPQQLKDHAQAAQAGHTVQQKHRMPSRQGKQRVLQQLAARAAGQAVCLLNIWCKKQSFCRGASVYGTSCRHPQHCWQVQPALAVTCVARLHTHTHARTPCQSVSQ